MYKKQACTTRTLPYIVKKKTKLNFNGEHTFGLTGLLGGGGLLVAVDDMIGECFL